MVECTLEDRYEGSNPAQIASWTNKICPSFLDCRQLTISPMSSNQLSLTSFLLGVIFFIAIETP